MRRTFCRLRDKPDLVYIGSRMEYLARYGFTQVDPELTRIVVYRVRIGVLWYCIGWKQLPN